MKVGIDQNHFQDIIMGIHTIEGEVIIMPTMFINSYTYFLMVLFDLEF